METSVKNVFVFGVEAIMVINKDSVNSPVGHKPKYDQMSWQGIGNTCYCSDDHANKPDW